MMVTEKTSIFFKCLAAKLSIAKGFSQKKQQTVITAKCLFTLQILCINIQNKHYKNNKQTNYNNFAKDIV